MPTSLSSTLDGSARRVLAYEAASGDPVAPKDSAADRVCAKLCGPLARLMGAAGFRLLLERALVLARKQAPLLRALRVNADGSLEGLDELEAKFGAEAVAEGEVALVAQLLGLLVTFIGPVLTLRLVQTAWPAAPLDQLKLVKMEALQK